ncbi:hypothetical protein RM780_18945 [Streptomyces sp. DSM 44917]|uniref:CHAT domain-containing protein n=1 Tax=Streptomyces boetiae TaxID=3075541 RepID=A0ABU2LBQ7_9ACTN|nr:hypothetical protein [Streptomyces sp. DSM 44917]MDT0309021.1 hypothetical protein [Streptomyces sp. DSM 44917]
MEEDEVSRALAAADSALRDPTGGATPLGPPVPDEVLAPIAAVERALPNDAPRAATLRARLGCLHAIRYVQGSEHPDRDRSEGLRLLRAVRAADAAGTPGDLTKEDRLRAALLLLPLVAPMPGSRPGGGLPGLGRILDRTSRLGPESADGLESWAAEVDELLARLNAKPLPEPLASQFAQFAPFVRFLRAEPGTRDARPVVELLDRLGAEARVVGPFDDQLKVVFSHLPLMGEQKIPAAPAEEAAGAGPEAGPEPGSPAAEEGADRNAALLELLADATAPGVANPAGVREAIREAVGHLERARDSPGAPAAFRSLLDSVALHEPVLSGFLGRDPARIRAAVERARDAPGGESSFAGQEARARRFLPLALRLAHELDGDAAGLDTAIAELERMKADSESATQLDARRGLLRDLAEIRAPRGSAEAGDASGAIGAGLASSRVLGNEVLMQPGTEHGLRAARAGASRGLVVAGWAVAEGDVARAAAGRGLVLRAAAVPAGVPEQLEALGHRDLAERWRRAAPAAGAAEWPAAGEPLIPSTLRRQALAALRAAPGAGEGPGGAEGAPPGPAELAAGLERCGAHALVYLVPGRPRPPGARARDPRGAAGRAARHAGASHRLPPAHRLAGLGRPAAHRLRPGPGPRARRGRAADRHPHPGPPGGPGARARRGRAAGGAQCLRDRPVAAGPRRGAGADDRVRGAGGHGRGRVALDRPRRGGGAVDGRLPPPRGGGGAGNPRPAAAGRPARGNGSCGDG